MAFPTLNKPLFRALTEFTDVVAYPDATLDVIAAEASKLMSADKWGDKADLGLVYLTAHMLSISKRSGGAAGSVTSERVGDLAKSYGSSAAGSGSHDLDQTSYGKQYRGLAERLPCRPLHIV